MRNLLHRTSCLVGLQMTAQQRIAPLKLRFVVVGGSLGGLAVAYSLSRAGHSVHVIERKDGLVTVRISR